MSENKLEVKLRHYIGKAINDFNMIETGDRVMVCVSGGKDSYTMVKLLNILRKKSRKFELHAFTLDQKQPGFDDVGLRAFMEREGIPYTVFEEDTFSIVTDKIPENKTYCGLCSRLRRGIIYKWAKNNGYNKIALGHHRDDMIETLLMSIFFNGEIKSMPPKLLTDDKELIVIRPMAYCQEKDIQKYADAEQFPIIPCNLCGSQENLMRQRIKKLVQDLALENPKIPSNMLHALQAVKPSQLMDKSLWDFKGLKAERKIGLVVEE